MKRILVGASTFILLLIVHPAAAAVFSRDWKTPGDGLLTYDDVNQREWLDLSVSRLSQFSVPRRENAVAEIGPGGLFDGFKWASQQDVRDLAVSSGIDTSTSDIAVNRIPVTSLIELMGPTVKPNLLNFVVLRSIGLTTDPQNNPSLPPYTGAALLLSFDLNTGRGRAEFNTFLPDDLLTPSSNGLMLFRAVPEPTASISSLMGVLATCFPRRKRIG